MFKQCFDLADKDISFKSLQNSLQMAITLVQ